MPESLSRGGSTSPEWWVNIKRNAGSTCSGIYKEYSETINDAGYIPDIGKNGLCRKTVEQIANKNCVGKLSITNILLYVNNNLSRNHPVDEIYMPLVNSRYPSRWKNEAGNILYGAPFLEDNPTYSDRYNKITTAF